MIRSSLLARLPFAFVLLLGAASLAADEPPLPGQLAVMRGHSETVYSVAFSPDGKLIATGSFDKSIKLWDSTTGKEVRTYGGPQGHQNLVLAIAMSADGTVIVSGGSDNTAKVWDIPSSTPLKEYLHTEAVTGISLSPDAKTVAASARDGTVKLFATVDGKQLFNLAGHAGIVTSVQFSSNGQLLATSGVDGTVRYWNPTTGQPIVTLGAHSGPVNGIAIHPNNSVAYSIGEDGLLKYWQLPPQPSKSLPPHADAIQAVALSSDNNTVVTGGADKVVRLANFQNGQTIRDLPGATASVSSVAVTPNNTAIAAGTLDGRLHFWKTSDGKLDASIPVLGGPTTAVAIRADSTQFAVAGADGSVRLGTLPLTPTKSIPQPDRILKATLRADGKVLTVGADKVIRFLKTSDGQIERQFPAHPAEVTASAITPQGDLVISGSVDELIRFWNGQNAQPLGTIAGHVGPITGLAVAPQGNAFVSIGQDGAVKFWTLPIAAPKVFAHPDAIVRMIASNDGNRFLTVGNDKQARLWNINNPQPERAYTANNQPITAVAIATDNATVAIAGADKSLSVWNAGTEVKKFAPLPDVVQSVAFSPDGKLVAVGLADKSIRLLQISDAKELKKLDGHAAPATVLTYTPKGDMIMSSGADKTVRLWNAADGVAKGQINTAHPVSTLTISKDGAKIAVSGPGKVVESFTIVDQKPIGTPIVTSAEVRQLAFSPDGVRLAVAGADNKVRVYGSDGKLQEAFAHDAPTTGVSFLPDGKRLLTASNDKTVKLWTSSFTAQGSHAGPVRQVVYTPQGDRAFTISDDKTLKQWDAKSGKETASYVAHESPAVALAMSTDGSRLITASGDKTAKVWNAADGKVLTTMTLPGVVTTATISGDGKRIAVAFTDGAVQRVKVYQADNGAELSGVSETATVVRALAFLPDQRRLLITGDDKVVSMVDVPVQQALTAHPGGVTAISYHPNGTQLLTSGKDKVVRLWDLAMMKELKSFGPLPEAVTTSTFSKDGALIGYASGKVVKVVNPTDGKEVVTFTHPAEVVSLAFNTDKSRVITGTTDNLARVWEVATGREVQSFSHGAAVRAVVFHPNNTNVISVSADKTAAIHALTMQRLIVASPNPLRSLTVTANGTHVITAGDDKAVKAWNLGNGNMEREFPGATASVQAVAVSKNVQLLATGGADKTVRLFNFNDGKLIAPITASGTITGIAFSANQQSLAVATDDKAVTVYNIVFQPGQPMPAEFGRPLQAFAHADVARAVTFAENGTLYSGGQDKLVKSWKIAADVPTKNFAHPNLVDAVALDPKGELLATGCHDGVVRIFDIPKNATLKQINAHTTPTPQPIYAVVWSVDGKQVLSCGYDATMKLWDVASGNLVREFKKYDEKMFPKGHQEAIFAAAFSPDGQFIASGSSDRMLKLWKVADATVVREFANPKLAQPAAPQPPAAHPGWIYGVRFTPDGQLIISSGSAPRQQGYLASWRVGDGQLVSGTELPSGPIYGLSLSKDGMRTGLACGPRNRNQSVGDAVIVKTPGK